MTQLPPDLAVLLDATHAEVLDAAREAVDRGDDLAELVALVVGVTADGTAPDVVRICVLPAASLAERLTPRTRAFRDLLGMPHQPGSVRALLLAPGGYLTVTIFVPTPEADPIVPIELVRQQTRAIALAGYLSRALRRRPADPGQA
jgi:hypothetical protein